DALRVGMEACDRPGLEIGEPGTCHVWNGLLRGKLHERRLEIAGRAVQHVGRRAPVEPRRLVEVEIELELGPREVDVDAVFALDREALEHRALLAAAQRVAGLRGIAGRWSCALLLRPRRRARRGDRRAVGACSRLL